MGKLVCWGALSTRQKPTSQEGLFNMCLRDQNLIKRNLALTILSREVFYKSLKAPSLSIFAQLSGALFYKA